MGREPAAGTFDPTLLYFCESIMPRIIVLDTLSPDGLALLDAAKLKGIEYEVLTGLKGDARRKNALAIEGRYLP